MEIVIVLFILLGTVKAFYAGEKYMYEVRRKNNQRCVDQSLSSLDCIAGGKRVIGVNAEAIMTRQDCDLTKPRLIVISQLCRTTRGQWFEHCFEIMYERIRKQQVNLLNEDQARDLLACDIAAYERIFGQLEVA